MLRELSGDPRLLVERKAASFVVKRRRLLAKAPHLTLLGFATDGSLFVGWLRQQLPKNGLTRDLGDEFVGESATIVGTSVHPQDPDSWVSAVPLDRVTPVWPQLSACLDELVARLEPPGYTGLPE